MKKILLIIPAFLVFVACHNYQADIDKLQAEKTDMAEAAKYKDSTITSFINEVNDIESNLAQIEIKQKQNDLAMASSGAELKGTQAERIKENIKAINELMKENKVKIAELNRKLKVSGAKLADFEKMVANLNQQMESKDKQVAELNEKLASVNVKVDSLNTQVTGLTTDNTEKTKVIEDQTMKLHTAYYTTGTAKELVDKKVLVKEGGFLGLGKSEKMMDNYDNSAFSQIDITKTSTIPIEAKDAKIVTTHPSDSYTIQHTGKDQISSLVITDPDRFWKTSKYLVVVVDK